MQPFSIRIHLSIFPPFTLTIMKGLTKTLGTSRAIISQTMDFLKESFVQASLAMASLCGLNAGHIWSNYLTRKQLSVILKGEVFQLSNLLNPVLVLPLCRKKALLRTAAEEGRRYYMRRRAELRQLPCSLVCQRIGRTYPRATSASSKYCLVALQFRWTTEAPCALFEGGIAFRVRVLCWYFLSSVCYKF